MLYPFDDLHRFHRPAALIASRSAKDGKQAYDAYLEALAPKPVPPEFAHLSDADRRTLAALGHPDFK